MFLKSLVLTFSLVLSAPAWAQIGKSDILRLAGGQTDAIVKALKLTPQQIGVVKPLLDSKFKEMADVKKTLAGSDQSEAAKNSADEALKAIGSKYDSRITSALNPDQLKKWNDLSKGWNSIK